MGGRKKVGGEIQAKNAPRNITRNASALRLDSERHSATGAPAWGSLVFDLTTDLQAKEYKISSKINGSCYKA